MGKSVKKVWQSFVPRLVVWAVLFGLDGGLDGGTIAYAAVSALEKSQPSKSVTTLKVLTTIKPLQALTQVVMQGVGTPQLLLEGMADPHHFSLAPSHLKQIKGADLVIWIGPTFEEFLVKALDPRDDKGATKTLALIATEGLQLLHRQSSQDCLLARACTHEETGHRHDHGAEDVEYTAIDPHIWFDVPNVKVMVQEICDQLSALDLENAVTYAENTKAFLVKLTAYEAAQKNQAKALRGLNFIAFHDAFAYLEKALGVTNKAPMVLKGQENPSLKSYGDLKDVIRREKITCLVVDPAHQGAVEEKLAKELGMGLVKIDTLGASIPMSPDHYFLMMQGMIDTLKTCAKKSVPAVKAVAVAPKKESAHGS